jgi:hypothetical protein
MAKLPVSLSKAVNAWKEVSANADQSVNLVLAGEAGLVACAQEKFSAGGTVPATWVGPLDQLSGLAGASGDILLVLVGADKEAEVLPRSKRGPTRAAWFWPCWTVATPVRTSPGHGRAASGWPSVTILPGGVGSSLPAPNWPTTGW